MKIFTLILVLVPALSHSQDLSPEDENDASFQIDTLFDKQGRIYSIINWKEGLNFSYHYTTEGRLINLVETTHKNDTQFDKVTHYYPSGKVKEQYSDYVIDHFFWGTFIYDGQDTGYYENGNVEFIKNFERGKLMHVKYFDPDGNPLNAGTFEDGNGRLIFYKNGIQVSSCNYKNGKLVRRSCSCN